MKRKTVRYKKQFMKSLFIFTLVFGLIFAVIPWQLMAYADETLPEKELPVEEYLPEEEILKEEPMEEAAFTGDEVIEEAVIEEETVVPVSNLDEPEVLLEDYIHVITTEVAESQDAVTADAMNGVVVSKTRGSRLTGADKNVYDKLREAIEKIADGTETSTKITLTFSQIFPEGTFDGRFTSEELGIPESELLIYDEAANGDKVSDAALSATLSKYDLSVNTTAVFRALLYDCPYILYWFDKTSGMSASSSRSVGAAYNDSQNLVLYCDPGSSTYDFYFAVSMDYVPRTYDTHNFANEGEEPVYKPIQTDVAKIQAIQNTATNAAQVVTYAANNYSTDQEKLEYYKDWICTRVEYNYAAVDNAQEYGDPWQLVYVFDDNTQTNVVCEGYSKAFKYLCDLTEGFSDKSLDCRLVTGVMGGGTGEGAHMWNVVELGGLNYLVDVTNCDAGSVGAPSYLFMKREGDIGVAVPSYDSYTVKIDERNSVNYSYDNETKNIYYDSELTLKGASSDGDTSGEDTSGENPLPMHDHKWGESTYTWNSTSTKVTAKRVCTEDTSHVEEETANVTRIVDKATFSAEGKAVYRATFSNPAFATQTKEETIPILTISNPVAKTYNGEKQVQKFTVKSGKTTLKEGIDYSVYYEKNIEPGTATAIVKMEDSELYAGSKKFKFSINKIVIYNTDTIYKTKTGNRYHRDGCKYLASSKIKTTVIDAEGVNLTPCSICMDEEHVTIKRTAKSIYGAVISDIANKTYTGKAITQSPTVKLGKTTLKSGTDYTLTYKNNINVGTATVYITGKGKYGGTLSKTFKIAKAANTITASNVVRAGSTKVQSFALSVKRKGDGAITYSSNNKYIKVNKTGKITVTKGYSGIATITIKVAATGNYNAATKKITVIVKPVAPTLKTLKSSAKGQMTVGWTKNNCATGYQIQYSLKKNFSSATTVTIKKAATVSKVIKSLKKGKKYYVRVRTYQTISKKNYYSPWSAAKTVTKK